MLFCDSCLEAAMEETMGDYESAIVLLREVGADIPDHECEAGEYEIECDCGCRR